MRELKGDVAEQLKALQGLSGRELRELWRATFGRPHPGWVQKHFLIHGLAYHLQEKAYGALTTTLQRKLAACADELQKPGHPRRAKLRIKPGTRLVREWGSETHVVTTLDEAFEYRGSRYASLSEIARLITKTRWSGPVFFGLKTTRLNARA